MASKKDKTFKVSVVVTIEVDKTEWLERFGEYIQKNSLVPEVTLVNFARRAVKEKADSLNMKTLETK